MTFEEWKDGYGLVLEPNYSKETEADCLAAFNFGKRESAVLIERQAAQIEMMRDFIETAPVSTGVCCCGESMEGHSSPMSCGHTPVDLWDHSVISVLSATPDQALERFAAKVREQCAQVCFDRAKRPNDGYWTDAGWATVCSANELAGEAILEIKEIPK